MRKQTPSRSEIWKMFDQIAPTYDTVNRAMTFGLDTQWRKALAKKLPKRKEMVILDGATGTGDQILSILKHAKFTPKEIVGIDLSEDMLKIGKEKLRTFPQVSLQTASLLEIPFPDAHFDAVTISFGIRNVTDVIACIKEVQRVLKPGGCLLILEGAMPTHRMLKKLHLIYLRHILPRLGGFLSKKPDAYRYLNETIETFPSGKAFCVLMEEAGLRKCAFTPLLGGAVAIYCGEKDGISQDLLEKTGRKNSLSR